MHWTLNNPININGDIRGEQYQYVVLFVLALCSKWGLPPFTAVECVHYNVNRMKHETVKNMYHIITIHYCINSVAQFILFFVYKSNTIEPMNGEGTSHNVNPKDGLRKTYCREEGIQ